MTPAARIQAAIEVLDAILEDAPAEQVLTNWARRSRYAGSKDRAAVRDHVYQALRCLRSYSFLGGAYSGRGLMIGALRSEKCDPSQFFTGEKFAPAALTQEEATSIDEPIAGGKLFDLPDWLIPAFKASLGADAEKAAAFLRIRAPVTLRVNTRKGSRDHAQSALAQEGIETHKAAIAKTALTVVEGERKVVSSALYLDGLVELQDGSSQAAMETLVVPQGARVLDFCAGGGGKTLALAARIDGNWFAHDVSARRMQDIPARAKRAGVKVEICSTNELSGETFDLVLCDVPCSGSGTWRRSPDAKWRFSKADLDRLIETQAAILETAQQYVSECGQLCYTTCSVLIQENGHQIDRFIAHNPHFKVTNQDNWPIDSQGDGFFLATLSRA